MELIYVVEVVNYKYIWKKKDDEEVKELLEVKSSRQHMMVAQGW